MQGALAGSLAPVCKPAGNGTDAFNTVCIQVRFILLTHPVAQG